MDSELPVKMAAATERKDQWSVKEQEVGGNLTMDDPMVEMYMVPDFQGMSGQGANQSTDRPKGST